MMNFSTNLKKVRKTLKLTQQKLSQMIKVSQRTISHYENGDSEPDIIMLCRLADALNVTIEQLVGYDAKTDPERYTELKSVTHKYYLNKKFSTRPDIIDAIGTKNKFDEKDIDDDEDEDYYF